MAATEVVSARLTDLRRRLAEGLVIPAHPLALTPERKLDEQRQRALTRYYTAAGAGGLAVGVHTTQFAIRAVGLLQPVLELAAETARERDRPPLLIAGVCGHTKQAVAEAELAAGLGYNAGLLSLSGLDELGNDDLLLHCRAIADVIPLFGFYLQPAVGGRVLDVDFWRRFVSLETVVGIKVAPFSRYRTFDVVRAVLEEGREEHVILYTGNDDSIVIDLISRYRLEGREAHIVGGLLGQWAVGTARAVGLLAKTKAWRSAESIPAEVLTLSQEVTDLNAAVFDAANDFAGCIAGIHEVLRRQGLLAGTWCLDPRERLSTGQLEEIDRVEQAYPHLCDDDYVRSHLDDWLR
ncbi:MAG TPA: dihydrodipicolinate synthase family protein [Plantibacter sp.]|uniref:dihydrodipicolinate synthase family protein n=1 Tax=Plantibacter sp. TaxID=1871045 RepID=UPI002B89AA68|nr:dihydrodipicolinate synthase family protein [Plantibacter sp.]